jgi:hypothetical protein
MRIAYPCNQSINKTSHSRFYQYQMSLSKVLIMNRDLLQKTSIYERFCFLLGFFIDVLRFFEKEARYKKLTKLKNNNIIVFLV